MLCLHNQLEILENASNPVNQKERKSIKAKKELDYIVEENKYLRNRIRESYTENAKLQKEIEVKKALEIDLNLEVKEAHTLIKEQSVKIKVYKQYKDKHDTKCLEINNSLQTKIKNLDLFKESGKDDYESWIIHISNGYKMYRDKCDILEKNNCTVIEKLKEVIIDNKNNIKIEYSKATSNNSGELGGGYDCHANKDELRPTENLPVKIKQEVHNF